MQSKSSVGRNDSSSFQFANASVGRKPAKLKARGSSSNPHNRFTAVHSEAVDDGWWQHEVPGNPQTELFVDTSKTIISTNRSPDIPFEKSVNPYRGCEHGCIYCYARPTHEYLDLSMGLDFESKIFFKPKAAALLRQEFSKAGYHCQNLMLGGNTDPYQPVEKEKRITRELLEVCLEYRHPVSITTKSALILRDMDLLQELAALDLLKVMVSVTTLSNEIKARLEPRTAGPAGRLRVIRELSAARIRVGVMIAPIIPFINDHELENIIAFCANSGVENVAYTMLRLPNGLDALFQEWLREHYPEREKRVMKVVRDSRAHSHGKQFGGRMTGKGNYAQLIHKRFKVACKKRRINGGESLTLRKDLFKAPEDSSQLVLL